MLFNGLISRSQAVVTDNEDFHSVVSICTIVFWTVSMLCIVGRVFTKISVASRLTFNDYSILLALVFTPLLQ